MLKLMRRRLVRSVYVVLWTKRNEVDKRSDDDAYLLVRGCYRLPCTTQQGNLFTINHQGLDKLKNIHRY